MPKAKIREISATVKVLIPDNHPANNMEDAEILETLRGKSTIEGIKIHSVEPPEE